MKGWAVFALFCVFVPGATLVSALPASAAVGPDGREASFKLPEPRTSGGGGVFDALSGRASASQGGFPSGEISAEELSTILWAACGRNRPEKGLTVPTAMALDPYAKIYVLGARGSFLYNWKNHTLDTVGRDDLRGAVGRQSFVSRAAYVLVIASDGRALAAFNSPRAGEWGAVLAGAMSQNIYLAAGAMNIGTRYMASMNEDAVRSGLKLAAGDTPICLMPLGKAR